MLNKRSPAAFIATCALGAFYAASAFAADPATFSAHDISAAAAKALFSVKDRRTDTKLPGKKKNPLAQAEKARRAERESQRKIVTYNLFNDPLFKLNGAITDKRQLGIGHGMHRLGTGFGSTVSAGQALNSVGNRINGIAPRPEEGEGAVAGCRDTPFNTGIAVKRELSACFAHQLDKSWKTQTYVTKGYVEGSQRWGGGLALGYAY